MAHLRSAATSATGDSWWRRRSVIGASVVIVLIAGAGAAVAHSSSTVGTQTFAGCLTSAGALVDVTLSSSPSTSCPTGTTSVTWTQQGPAGDAGAVGAIGSPGAVGKTGHAGPAGPTGSAGVPGAQGPQGVPGNAGKTGHAGTRGPTGPAGPGGATGPVGPSGATGVTGAAGTGLLHGSGPPAKSLGSIGDSYIDVSDNLLYGPKTSTGWGTGASLVGPPGLAGPSAGQPAQCNTSSITVVVTTADALTAALADAVPGAVIYVAPGTYTGDFTASGSGTQSSPITVCGAGATLTGTGITSGYVLHLLNANWWQFYGFTVEDGQKGVMLDGSNNNLLDGLYVHDIGDEGVHFRTFSSNNTLSWSHVENTGLRVAEFGEAVYVGSAQSNWCSLTACAADTSNGNQIIDNTVDDTPAENVDIKEGTTGGLISGNRFDGGALVLADASAWVNVKGNSWLVEDNVGMTSPQDGFQVHQVLSGWGRADVFADNEAIVNGPGYGYYVQGSASFNNIVYCSNTASGAGSGLSTIACTPGGP